MKKIFKSKISIIAICLVVLILIASIFSWIGQKDKLVKVGSKSNLQSIYENRDGIGEGILKKFFAALLFPWNIISAPSYDLDFDIGYDKDYSSGLDFFNPSGSIGSVDSTTGSWWEGSSNWYDGGTTESTGVEGDYSSTNIQVENVDEADIIKTDGEYIYSISDFSVVITDARNANNPVIVSEIETSGPEEILLYNEKLIIISGGKYATTEVEIYNIADKANPYKIKSYSVKQDYYTSRVTNDNLYIISTGYLKEDSDDNVIAHYTEDSEKTDIGYNNMYYFKNNISRYETIVSRINLKEEKAKFDVKAYLVDIDNIYVSQNNMYLAEETYKDDVNVFKTIASIFGFKGIYGLEDMDYDYSEKTKIYKLELKEDGKVEYTASATIEGSTIDQFSFDEYKSNLRVAVDTGNATKVLVLDNELNLIGETGELAEGENMYSSRFMGDKAYLVTYQTIDPLFVIDLSNPEDPNVLGELKIPGYSTYLHPYDENHIIGIGMQTEERIYRNSEGKVTSTTAVITGMKMALFDVTNVNNPKQISEVTIGDSRTKSAVLTNHKALLFSKEKQLLAIPINSYKTDIEEIAYDDDISDVISSYTKDYYGYVSEGYLVYNINLEDGINLKGLITHEGEEKTSDYYKNYGNKLLRGVYIKDYLYTVSQHMMQVHKLDTLEKVSDIEI